MCFALGVVMLQSNPPVAMAAAWYVGALMGLLGVIVPYVAKSLRKLDEKTDSKQTYQSTEFDWH